ncbi:DcaP family trimeric outer membrane transporter [Chryseobacterium sp.]|uniref:DcaP family trimeric outer membrane transporter n=1 Tax=Chryseobacterium sp. TaxID=1871047 RepID=UPI00289A4019|nr:DcaP family trimeric outer membrane transporter [Chryseobacterium sp.]
MMKKIFIKIISSTIFILTSIDVSGQLSLLTLKPEDQIEREVYIKGFIQADFMTSFQNMRSKDGFSAYSIEIPQTNAISSNFSVRQTTFGIGFKQKNSQNDQTLSVYTEIDFAGPNNTTAPRFRHGYIQWKRWLAGQSWSNFSDIEMLPMIFDFMPPDGLLLTRRLQLRYTVPVSKKGNLSFSLEDPNTPSIRLPSDSLGWHKQSIIPTFSVLYRYGNEKSYIKAGAVISPMSYNMKHTLQEEYKTKTTAGWGAMISGKIRTDTKNAFSLQTSFGKGYSTYNTNLREEGYDAIPNVYNKNILETLNLFNIVGVYEHWWASRWSSILFFSYSNIGYQDFIPKDMTKSFHNISGNIIFHPYKKVRLGIEGNYGRRQNFRSEKAEGWRVQASTKVYF